jgi:hypothetical protein
MKNLVYIFSLLSVFSIVGFCLEIDSFRWSTYMHLIWIIGLIASSILYVRKVRKERLESEITIRTLTESVNAYIYKEQERLKFRKSLEDDEG